MSAFYDLSKTPRNILNQAIVRAIAAANNGLLFDPSDMTTLYQDAAGTIPVTAVEQPVGKMLDKSRGFMLGPELVSNGDFSSGLTGWSSGNSASISVTNGVLRVTNTTTAYGYACAAFQTIIGTTYKVTASRVGWSVNIPTNIHIATTFGGWDVIANMDANKAFVFVAKSTTSYVILNSQDNVSGGYIEYDNISVRELYGNHATQSVTARRPVLSARYNLLTKTEDFADAAWSKPTATITSNSMLAPDGTQTGDKISYSSAGAGVTQDLVIRSTSCTVSVYLKPSDIDNGARILLYNVTTATLLSSVVSTLITTGGTAVGNGWYRYTLSASTGFSANDTVRVYIYTDNQAGTIAGSSLYVWGAQLNIGQNPLPYQRVNTTTDYDSVGWPRYLRFDGIDDFFNLPYMGLYAGGACSIVSARDAVLQSVDTFILSERSTTDADPKYFPSRQLANGGNMDAYISDDAAAVVLDAVGSAFGGAADKVIRSVVDTGSNIKLYKNGVLAANDNYTRSGTLTLNNTTLGASVSTTTSNYASMKLYGLIITKSALTDAQRRACERHLSRKAGVAL